MKIIQAFGLVITAATAIDANAAVTSTVSPYISAPDISGILFASTVANFTPPAQMVIDFDPLLRVEHTKGVEFVHIAQILASHGHATASSPISSRRAFSAPRTQVLTVPSGFCNLPAISVCDIPSKYASSSTRR